MFDSHTSGVIAHVGVLSHRESMTAIVHPVNYSILGVCFAPLDSDKVRSATVFVLVKRFNLNMNHRLTVIMNMIFVPVEGYSLLRHPKQVQVTRDRTARIENTPMIGEAWRLPLQSSFNPDVKQGHDDILRQTCGRKHNLS